MRRTSSTMMMGCLTRASRPSSITHCGIVNLRKHRQQPFDVPDGISKVRRLFCITKSGSQLAPAFRCRDGLMLLLADPFVAASDRPHPGCGVRVSDRVEDVLRGVGCGGPGAGKELEKSTGLVGRGHLIRIETRF